VSTVRLGTEADRGAAVAVWRASDEARRGSPVQPAVEDTVRSRIGQERTWLTVTEDGGEMVGVAFAMPARADDGAGDELPGLCHVAMVFVLPGHWGKGVGGLLLDATLDEARRRDYRRVQLWTHEDNQRSQRLYSRRGFQHEGRTKDPDDGGGPIGLWSRDL
jgi:GNAT superfamily N-acetyltransferase